MGKSFVKHRSDTSLYVYGQAVEGIGEASVVENALLAMQSGGVFELKGGKGRGMEDVWVQLDAYRRAVNIRNMRTEETVTLRVASLRLVTLAKLPLVHWPPPDALADAKRFGLWHSANGVSFDVVDLVAATTENCMCWVRACQLSSSLSLSFSLSL